MDDRGNTPPAIYEILAPSKSYICEIVLLETSERDQIDSIFFFFLLKSRTSCLTEHKISLSLFFFLGKWSWMWQLSTGTNVFIRLTTISVGSHIRHQWSSCVALESILWREVVSAWDCESDNPKLQGKHRGVLKRSRFSMIGAEGDIGNLPNWAEKIVFTTKKYIIFSECNRIFFLQN